MVQRLIPKAIAFQISRPTTLNTIAVTTLENDFVSLVSRDITTLRNMSTTRTSGSVCQTAHESIDLLLLNQALHALLILRKSNTLELFS